MISAVFFIDIFTYPPCLKVAHDGNVIFISRRNKRDRAEFIRVRKSLSIYYAAYAQ